MQACYSLPVHTGHILVTIQPASSAVGNVNSLILMTALYFRNTYPVHFTCYKDDSLFISLNTIIMCKECILKKINLNILILHKVHLLVVYFYFAPVLYLINLNSNGNPHSSSSINYKNNNSMTTLVTMLISPKGFLICASLQG